MDIIRCLSSLRANLIGGIHVERAASCVRWPLAMGISNFCIGPHKKYGTSNICLESGDREEQFELLFTTKFGWEGAKMYPNACNFVHIS
jgi:hypothetical protein